MADLSLDGLASGMGTEQMVNKLMQLEQKPIINLQKEKQNLEESKSAWRDVNSRLDKLEGTMTQLKLSSTFNSNSASSSNEDIVSASATSDAEAGSYQVDVKGVAQQHRLGATTKVNKDNPLSDELETAVDGDISVNGTAITVDTDETLTSLKNKINDSGAGVSATIIDGNLVMESNQTGTENSINLTDNANNLLDNLGLNGDLNDTNNDSVLQTAQDAEIEINGISNITSSDNTFSDAVDGVTFNINDGAQPGDSATIDVSRDTEKASSAVEGFVEQYNSVMNFIDGKLDYDPETEEAGALQGDSTLMRLQMRLRSMVTDRVDNDSSYNQLSSVGISVDRDGVMSFDSGELTDALQDSPQDVMNLFTAEQDEEGFDGVGTRMDSYVDQLLQSNTGTIPRRLEFYNTRMDNIDDDIEDKTRRLESTRERYKEQFTAMETAMSEMQQQQSWMQNQLSSLGSGASMISSLT